MSKIFPFRAMYFNPDYVKDYARIVAPPEFHADSIDEIYRLKNENEFNIYNMLEPLYLGKFPQPASNSKKNIGEKTRKFQLDKMRSIDFDEHFSEIAKKYAGWLETGKIFRDEKPGFYVYERDFWDAKAKTMRRKRSLLALMSLEDPEEGTIKFGYKPDEEEIEQAFRLMKITFSQFSPVIMGYSDPKNSVETLLKQVDNTRPPIFTFDEEGFFHSLHFIHDEGIIDALQKIFNDFSFGIIEGAHTYIAAYKFMQEMKRLENLGSGTETVYNVFVNMIALDNDEYTEIKPAVKVLTREDAQKFKKRDLSKQTILRFSSAATQRFLRKNVQTDADEKTADAKDRPVDPDNIDAEDEIVVDASSESSKSVFSPSFIASSCETLGIEHQTFDWQGDLDTVRKVQTDLNHDNFVKQAVMFLPTENKYIILKINNEDTLRSILPGRRNLKTDKLDINVFWRSFLSRLFIGFDDDKHSMNLWSIDQLSTLIENAENNWETNTKLESNVEFAAIDNQNLRTQPSYLLSSKDINENLKSSGMFMIFKKPDAKEFSTLLLEGVKNSRQVYRLLNVPYIGLISYRMDMSEDELEDDDEE